MTSWKQERDRLIEETRAFVLGVAQAHPSIARRLSGQTTREATATVDAPATAQPVSETHAPLAGVAPDITGAFSSSDIAITIEARQETMTSDEAQSGAAAPAVEAAARAQDTVAIPDLLDAPPAAAAMPEQPAPPPAAEAMRLQLPKLPERMVIASRVAAFKAQQDRLLAEREAYYEETRARIRNALGNENGDGRLQ